MADHDHDEPSDGGELLPAVRPRSALAPVDPRGELRRAAGSPMAVPMIAAAAMQATASALTGAMAAMLRPWLTGVPVTPPWAGEPGEPGVHISYTHIEVHWPAR